MYDRSEFARQSAHLVVRSMMVSHVGQGLLLEQDVPMLCARLSEHSTLEGALESASVIVEAVTEDVAIKQALYRDVEEALVVLQHEPGNVLLCSNTLQFSVVELTAQMRWTKFCERVICVRFFQPCWFIDEVFVSRRDLQPEATWQALRTTMHTLGLSVAGTEQITYEKAALCKSLRTTHAIPRTSPTRAPPTRTPLTLRRPWS